MSKKLSRWYKKRREEKAKEMIREHMALVVTIAEEFLKAIKNAVKGDRREVRKSHRIISMTEKEADVMRKKIIDELARGELAPTDRADLMRLARRVDWTADGIHESSRILVVMLPKIEEVWSLSTPLKELCIKMAALSLESAKHLLESVNKMMIGDVEKMLNLSDQVERIEEDVDSLYEEARKEFLKLNETKIAPGIMVIFSQFLDHLENTSDRQEHVCDQIRAIAVGMISRPKRR